MGALSSSTVTKGQVDNGLAAINCWDQLGETDPMNTPLRFNEALLIADRAFRPFQCVAWAPQDGTGVVSISVIDRTSTRSSIDWAS